MKHPSRGALVLGFSAVYLIWGSTYLAIKFAVVTIPPFLMAGTRQLAAGAILYLLARRRGGQPPTGREWKAAAPIGALLLLGGNGLVSWAEMRVASGPAALIVASVPLWMVALSAIGARKRPPLPVIAGLALGLGGIALLVLPASGDAHPIDRLGAGALLLAALCWSVGSLASRRAPLPKSTLLATAMEAIAGGAALWIAGLAAGEGADLHLSAITARSAISLVYLTLFGSVVGFSAYVWLLKVTTPERVSTYAFVNPFVAVSLGVALGGEALTLRMASAAALIVGAVALILRFGRPRAAQSTSPTRAEPPEPACEAG
ncbi:MAG: EamA family transporter [Thermoanaerobaculia bacterium]